MKFISHQTGNSENAAAPLVPSEGRLAEGSLNGSFVGPPNNAQIPVLIALQSCDTDLRATANHTSRDFLATLQQIGRKKQSAEQTMNLLQRELDQRRSRRRFSMGLAIPGVTSLAVLYFLLGSNPGFFWMLLILYGALMANRAVNLHQDMARSLGEIGDPRAVGVLAVALRDGDPDLKPIALQALRNLLPRVRASDAAFLNAEQRSALMELARNWARGGDSALKIAMLKALEQIGDERAIPIAEFLLNSYYAEVREAAEACLPALQTRLQRAQENATLLRASKKSQDGSGKGELLRPASEYDVTPPDELLRPL